MNSFSKQYVKLANTGCGIYSKIKYYSGNVYAVKGIKRLSCHTSIYLIEFLDHNRAWVTKQEVIVEPDTQ